MTVKEEAGLVLGVRVAAVAGGGFVVAWDVSAGGVVGREVYVQLYDANAQAVGGPVRANPAGSGDQRLGGLAAFSDGGFVVVFDDSRGDTTDYGVKARLFNATGSAGATITLNETASGDQTMPDVAVLDVDDEWVAVWIDANPTTAPKKIQTRRFYRDGTSAPGVRERIAPTTLDGDQTRPRGAAGTGDRVFMVWESPSLASGGGEIGGRLFAPDGDPLGPELIVNEVTAGAQTAPAVAGGANRFVVAWQRPDGTSSDVAMRIFDGDGNALGAETQVHGASTGSEREPAVALGSDGGFVVAWVAGTGSGSRVKLRGWDKEGQTIIDELAVDGGAGLEVARPRVAWVPGGTSFVVIWQSKHATEGLNILTRRVTTGANAATPTLGAETVANTTVAGDQQVPVIAVGTTGVTTMCWETGDDIVCRTVQANGATAVAEFKPHVTTAGVQKAVHLRHTSQGRLLVAWETDGVDFEGTAVQVRQFPALGAPSGKRIMGNRQVLGSQTRPFVVPLANQSRFFVGWEAPGRDGSGQAVVYRVVPTP